MVALIATEVSDALASRETSRYGQADNPFKKSDH